MANLKKIPWKQQKLSGKVKCDREPVLSLRAQHPTRTGPIPGTITSLGTERAEVCWGPQLRLADSLHLVCNHYCFLAVFPNLISKVQRKTV